MKKLASTAILMLSFSLPMAHADDRHHPEKAENGGQTTAPKSMGMMDMNRMQDMHKTMERIQQSKDPAERQRLMQEHMDEMRKMMGDMHGMMGKGMSGGMMEKRMDMMQGMMEQMMEHMMAAEGAKPLGGKEEGAADEHDHQKK